MRAAFEVLTRVVHKRKLTAIAVAIVVSGIAVCGLTAIAQSGVGSIQGTVHDATGAVIPNATVSVVQNTTNAIFTTKSNDVGYYQLPGLFTGTYTVTISAQGMKTYTTSIELLVAQNAVINPVMTAGAITQQVVVQGNAVQLTTTDSGVISSALENQRINQLPMNGRMLLTLVEETTPGIQDAGQQLNGLMPEALEYVADGVSLSNRQMGGEGGLSSSNRFSAQAQTPDPDSVQEARLITNGGAQYSEPSSVIITTKSGTDSLHGTLFETARNNAIGIARARQNPSNYSAPHYVRNEYGVSAGGPIIIPHVYHGKDKSFWFLGYEKFSLASFSYLLVTVPTVAMRGGDFSGLLNSSGVLQQLYDPATTAPSANCNGSGTANQYCRAPFPNNQIPTNRLSPVSKILFDTSPLPTLSEDPLVAGNLNANDFDNEFIPTWTFRLDHVFNEKNRAYLRYTSNQQAASSEENNGVEEPTTIAGDGLPADASGELIYNISSFAAGLGYTHIFSPTFFAETVIGQQWFHQYYRNGGDLTTDYDSELGLPNNTGLLGLPEFTGLIEQYDGNRVNYGMSQTVSDVDENLTKIVGKHQMYFGGRYRHEGFGYAVDRTPNAVSFGNLTTGLYLPSSGANYTATPNTGYEEADFYLGSATSYAVHTAPIYAHYHDMEFDAYFQDDYHVSRNITANLGLRWEAHPAVWTGDGLMTGFDYKNDAMVLAAPPTTLVAEGYTTQNVITNMQKIGAVYETPAQAGMPATTLMRNYMLTFGPRVGLAILPFGGKHGTVLRGGYGRYIYPEPIRSYMSAHQSANNPFNVNYTESYTAANQSPDGLPNYLLRYPQAVVMGANSANVVNSTTSTAILPGVAIYANSPAMPPDYVTEANFTLEQPLKGNSAIRGSYVWSHGTNLDHYYYPNEHPSNFVWEAAYGIIPPTGSTIGSNQYSATATGPYDQKTWGANSLEVKDGWSNDSSLQLNYEHLYHHGIAYQISYVWSKPMRFGGNTSRDSLIYPAANYLGVLGSLGSWTSPYGTVGPLSQPPAIPSGLLPWQEYHALDWWESYIVDTEIPKQDISFNGIVSLPFGRGKRFLSNSSRLLDEAVGGWQIAGDGSIVSQDFPVTASNWGPTNPLQVYKHKAPITDCRSGICLKAFEWFNGYVAPTANANVDCSTKCISGLPSKWAPYQTPIDNTPGTTNYGTNDVQINLINGNTNTIAYSPGPEGSNPRSRTILNGPINYTADLSVFKVFPITESVNLRFNADAFNALNVQGYNNPNATDGTENMTSSYNTPRQLQFTLRLQF